jgi:hypothetical protein
MCYRSQKGTPRTCLRLNPLAIAVGEDEDGSLIATATSVPAPRGAHGEDNPIRGQRHRATLQVAIRYRLVIFLQARGASPVVTECVY